jgi:hypothetical protein
MVEEQIQARGARWMQTEVAEVVKLMMVAATTIA